MENGSKISRSTLVKQNLNNSVTLATLFSPPRPATIQLNSANKYVSSVFGPAWDERFNMKMKYC